MRPVDTFNETGNMEFIVPNESIPNEALGDEGLEETNTTITYKLFADDEDFKRWWETKGVSSGVPKPKTSSVINEGMCFFVNMYSATSNLSY